MKSIINALPLPSMYYHSESCSYYRQAREGTWIKINESSAKKYLNTQGYSSKEPDGISESDRCMQEIQDRQNVSYVGPLAGYKSGPYKMCGYNVLVDSSPTIIKPSPGDWSTINKTFEAVLKLDSPGQENDQLRNFHLWLAAGYKAVRSGNWSPGQILVLAGEPRAGKSLIQAVVTKILGGRSAKPHQFMSGDTTFNRELFGAEHLMVEDEPESSRIEARRSFGANVKIMSVNREHKCHGKNKDGITLTPIRRVSISVNDTPERIKVLPPLEEDIRDKMILFKAHVRSLPMPTTSETDKQAFMAQIEKELPAFIDYLTKLELLPTEKEDRFGFKAYQHEGIVKMLEDESPEGQLADLIDGWMRGEGWDKSWSGTSKQFFDAITRPISIGDDAEHLLKNKNLTGQYLSRLEKTDKFKGRIKHKTVNGHTHWEISAPPSKTTTCVSGRLLTSRKPTNQTEGQ